MCYMNCPYEKKGGRMETNGECKGSKYFDRSDAYCRIIEEENEEEE
mgnify:FL=1